MPQKATIAIEKFGKDHWSTFAYAECCCVDSQGVLDNRRLRVNENKRPIRSNGLGWDPKYGTVMEDGGIWTIPDPEHDDIDCLDDLEAAGLIEQVGTLIKPKVRLTKRGYIVAAELRQHKAEGGSYGNFKPIKFYA